MTLLKIYERQYDKDGKQRFINVPIKDAANPGQKIKKSVVEVYYMDLTEDEELLMRETGTFGFERVLPGQVLGKKELDKGMIRKDQIFSNRKTTATK